MWEMMKFGHKHESLFSFIQVQMVRIEIFQMYAYAWVSIHTYIYLLCLQKGSRNNGTPVATNTIHSQFLDSIKYQHCVIKKAKLELLEVMCDLRIGSENQRGEDGEKETEASYTARK